MGPDFVGPRLESVATMMDRVQAVLLRYLDEMGGRARFSFTQGQSEVSFDLPIKHSQAKAMYGQATLHELHTSCLSCCLSPSAKLGSKP